MTRELPYASRRDCAAVVRATVFIVAVSGLMILGGSLEAQCFLVSPIICSASSHVSKRLERTGLPASFSTFSSSGLSIGSTFRTLGRQIANDIEELSGQQGSWRSGAILGVIFYAIREGMDEPDNAMEHALARLTTQLPFVGSIIGESHTPRPNFHIYIKTEKNDNRPEIDCNSMYLLPVHSLLSPPVDHLLKRQTRQSRWFCYTSG